MKNEEKKSIDETLDEIAKGSRRSKIVRLREIFDKVEAVKANGATNKAIVEGLKEHGLIFDVNNFKNARSRILKERALEALSQITGSNYTTPKTQVASTPTRSPPPKSEVPTSVEMARPPGITNAAWSEMQVKAAAEKRRKT